MNLRFLLACGALGVTMGGALEAQAQPSYSWPAATGCAPVVVATPCAYGPWAYAPQFAPPPIFGHPNFAPHFAPPSAWPSVSGRAIIPPGVRVVDVPPAPQIWAPPAPSYGWRAEPSPVDGPSFIPKSLSYSYATAYAPSPQYSQPSVSPPSSSFAPPTFAALPQPNLPRCDLLYPGQPPTGCFLPRDYGPPVYAYWNGYRVIFSGG